MPQLNNIGEWCSGIAGVGVYWQGGTIWPAGEAGGAQWYNNTEVIAHRFDGVHELGLWSYDVWTKAETLLATGPISLLCGSKNNDWIIQQPDGIRDSNGRFHVSAGIGDGFLGPDGSYVLKLEYHSIGPYDLLFEDNSRIRVSEEAMWNVQNYGDGQLTWQLDNFSWVSRNLPIPKPLENPVHAFKYISINGAYWQIYQMSDARWVFHPYDDNEGYVLYTGDAWRFDAIQLDVNNVHFVFANQIGEPPNAIVELDINLSSPRVDLSKPEEPEEPEVKTPEIAMVAEEWVGKLPDGLKNGQVMEFYDKLNPDLGYRVKITIEGGGIYMELTNAAGSDKTSKLRPVKLG
jgi:hypothetical protein